MVIFRRVSCSRIGTVIFVCKDVFARRARSEIERKAVHDWYRGTV
jgi:hypothetical protein